MPIYEFTCEKCGRDFEEIASKEASVNCPYCGAAETRKMMSTCARRSKGGDDGGYMPSSGGGCSGCSGGNCASCGH